MSDPARIRRVRPELRVVISSATIEAQHFVDFFNTQPPPPTVASSGTKAGDDMLPPPAKKSRWDKKERDAVKLDEAVMVRLEGRAFPVEIAYLEESTNNVVQKAVETIFDIHLKVGSFSKTLGDYRLMPSRVPQQPPGDILVFLTGRDEIDRCLQQISDYQHQCVAVDACSTDLY